MAPDTITENQFLLAKALADPINHITVELGINKFKKELDTTFPNLHKSVRNRLIKAFKKRGWMEYKGIAKYRGSFPTHPEYGTSVEVTTDNKEEKITVNAKREAK